ncbi:uncharacterized protein LOC143203575 [Rhynchophorus ferrugineus]|uniref:uncharacterized protein LOC143203575 n=1 Tax=Rhynchophorus ferrugineus TaxID=354439 RepID=UPI003FCE6316
MLMDILAAALVLFLTYVYIHNKKDPKPIFGVYSRPGKWFFIKYPAFLTLMVLRRLKYYLVGKDGLYDIKELEKIQPLSEHPLAFDAVFFHGATLNGTYLCAGGERRRNGVVNGLFYLLHPEFGMLKSPKLPNTKLVMDPEAAKEGKKWSAEGITFTPVEPMRRWNISYNGKMRSHESPETVFEVIIQATFTSTLPWVSFDVDLPAKTMARAIAREPWSRKKFELMKEAHQSHYEQMGDIVGTIKVNGKELPLKMDGFRDHSFGFKRDWTLMHRYIFHMFYLENQTRITLGVISQPCTASQVEMGYVVFPNGKLEMIESCDLQLWQHGESGRPSDQISFSFTTKSNIFECMVTYNKTASHFVGGNEVVKMYERFADCNVNGVKGKSISEWCYNNVSGNFDLNQYKC